MRLQEAKSTFVYSRIKQCILEGQIPPGNALSSPGIYCEQFHVGGYTANRIFDALRAEGLMDIQPHLAPIIASRKDSCSSSDTVFETLKRRESILQLYQTFVFTLPSLVVFSLQECDAEIIPHYKQATKVLRSGGALGEWFSPSKLGYDIPRIGGNSLFSKLYFTFGFHNKLAFSAEDCPHFSKHFLRGSASVTSATIDTLKDGEPLTKHNQLSDMYQKPIDSTEHTLNYLSETTPKYPARTGSKFLQNPTRGQDYHYSEIVDDTNLEIGLGECSIGIYLPYGKQLANQYGVSLSTVRKALSELEQRGFVKKLNGKGAIIIELDDTKLHQLALNSGYVEKALCYLHALQLMVLIVHPAALVAAARFTRKELGELTDRFTSPGPAYLADIQEAVLKHTTLEPLYVMLSETNHLLEWGHHFAYYPSKRHTLSRLNRKVITTFRQLCEENIGSFADGMVDCYRYILICMKKNVAEEYRFHNVANVRVLERYQLLTVNTRREYMLRLLRTLSIPSLTKNV